MKTGTKIAFHYLLAVAAVIIATALRFWLEHNVGPMPMFITWYPSVLLIASIGGVGPGLVTTLLAALAADYWFVPPAGFGMEKMNDVVAMGIFVGSGIFVSVLAERLRRTRWTEAVSATQEKELALLNMGNVMALDLDHHILRWSEGNQRLYGFDAQEAQGQFTYELLQTRFARQLKEIQNELMKTGYWEGEVTRRRKDGTPLALAILWALRRDHQGKPQAILEVSTDLTTQKAAEEALRQQSEELAQQNEELSQQSEELSGQNEELQAQSEEIQSLNTELVHREEMLQTLLDASRLSLSEDEVMDKICRAAMEMIGSPATGVVVCEHLDGQLEILASAGFDGAMLPSSWSAQGSFVEMMLRENRTACLEDTSVRPDLNLLPVAGHPRFAAVISSPMRIRGKCIGAVSIYSNVPQQWSAEQFRLIEWLAAQSANTLEAMRLAAKVLSGQQQNEFLANILQASSQPFGMGYPDGHLGLINKAFEQLTGYSGEELRSIDWGNVLTPPEWREIEMRKLEELHHTDLPVRYEKEYIRKDGRRVPIELLVHLIKDEVGKPLYYYSFLTDITERKQAQDALRQGEERLRFALETSHIGAWDLDLVDKTAFRSLEHDRIFGYKELLPQWTYDKFIEHVLPEDRAAVNDQFRQAMERLVDWNFECRIRRVDGQIRWIWAAGRPSPDSSGAPRHMAGIVQDITERRMAAEVIQQTAVELQRSNKDLEQFAYVTSHDLKEPLRMVTAFTGLLRDRYKGQLDSAAEQYISFAADAATRMQGLVDDLLAYARIGRDKTTVPVDFNVALDKAMESLQMRMEETHARITHDPLPTLSASALELSQLFQNLIGNAIKFRQEGMMPEVHVSATRVADSKLPENASWQFSVRDNGIGIEPQYTSRIFEIFQRLHTREDYPGTGVGLAICKKIVERYGGRIWVESAIGKGSTFFFTLPGELK